MGSGTRTKDSGSASQFSLHSANHVPIPTYPKSTFRIPMTSSLWSAYPWLAPTWNDHHRKPCSSSIRANGYVNRNQHIWLPSKRFMVTLALFRSCFEPLWHSEHCTEITLCRHHLRHREKKNTETEKTRRPHAHPLPQSLPYSPSFLSSLPPTRPPSLPPSLTPPSPPGTLRTIQWSIHGGTTKDETS